MNHHFVETKPRSRRRILIDSYRLHLFFFHSIPGGVRVRRSITSEESRRSSVPVVDSQACNWPEVASSVPALPLVQSVNWRRKETKPNQTKGKQPITEREGTVGTILVELNSAEKTIRAIRVAVTASCVLFDAVVGMQMHALADMAGLVPQPQPQAGPGRAGIGGGSGRCRFCLLDP